MSESNGTLTMYNVQCDFCDAALIIEPDDKGIAAHCPNHHPLTPRLIRRIQTIFDATVTAMMEKPSIESIPFVIPAGTRAGVDHEHP